MSLQAVNAAPSRVSDAATRRAVQELQEKVRTIKGILDAMVRVTPDLGRVVVKCPVAVPDAGADPTGRTRNAQPGELVRNGSDVYISTDVVERKTTQFTKLQAGSLDASDINNDSGVSGTTVADALDQLDTDLSDAVVKTPAGAQEITQPISTYLQINCANQSFYYPVVFIDNATLMIGNTPLAAPTWPPTTPSDGRFLIASRRITSGAGGSTLNVISDTGAVTRIDQPFLQRQNSAPATDGTQGYIWIQTGVTPERVYYLLNGGWELAV